MFAFDTHGHQQIQTGQGSRTSARCHHFDVSEFFARQLHGIHHRGRHDNRRPMLVIMENGNAHAGFQFFFDLKTFRGFDVLKIDPAKSRLKCSNNIDHAFNIGFCNLDIKHVNAGEFFE